MTETNGLQIVKRIDEELDFRGETRVELAKFLGIFLHGIRAEQCLLVIFVLK